MTGETAPPSRAGTSGPAPQSSRTSIAAAAIGMIVVNLLSVPGVIATWAVLRRPPSDAGGVPNADSTRGIRDAVANGPWLTALLVVGLALGAFGVVGALFMLARRGRGVAVAAAVVTILNVAAGCVWIAGIAVGIWAFVVLLRDDVRAAFGRPDAASAPTSAQAPPPLPALRPGSPLAVDAAAGRAVLRPLAVVAIALNALMALGVVGYYALGQVATAFPLGDAADFDKIKLQRDVLHSPWAAAGFAAPVLMNAFGVFGGIRMLKCRSYGIAVAAVAATVVNPSALLCCPACVVNIGFGTWATIVLLRADVREAFRAA